MEKQSTYQENSDPPHEEFSLLDILLLAAHHRRIITRVTSVFLLIGVLIAVFSPPNYSVIVRLIPELSNSGSGLRGLSSLRGLGLSIPLSPVGLTEETYPAVLKSREVRLAVARESYSVPRFGTTMTLVEYYNRPPSPVARMLKGIAKITIKLPGAASSLFRGGGSEGPVGSTEEIMVLTEQEDVAIRKLGESITVKIDRVSGMLSVAVTTNDPLLSVQIAKQFIHHLTTRVRALYTQKAKESRDFLESRFVEAQAELEDAEEDLATFMDQNRNPQTAQLRSKVERLQRQVNFKSQLYSDLQTQLTLAEIDLQRSTPVITILEGPVKPLEPSGPKRKLIVILSLLLGLSIGMGFIALRENVVGPATNEDSRAKWVEIRGAFSPRLLLKWKRRP